MEGEYKSILGFMTKNPAGQLLCATALSIAIAGVYAAFETEPTYEKNKVQYVQRQQPERIADISDLIKE